MKQTITESLFHEAFHHARRADQFSYGARSALFEYLTEIEDGSGEEIELDVVAICCDWSEHASAADWAKDYFNAHTMLDDLGLDPEATDDEIEAAATEYIRDNGFMLTFDGGIVVSSF